MVVLTAVGAAAVFLTRRMANRPVAAGIAAGLGGMLGLRWRAQLGLSDSILADLAMTTAGVVIAFTLAGLWWRRA